MTALRYDLSVQQNTSFTVDIPVLDAANTPAAVDGWTVDGLIRHRPGGALIYTWPSGNLTASGTTVTAHIPAPASAAWDWSSAWYRIRLTAPNPDVNDPASTRLVQGWIRLDRD